MPAELLVTLGDMDNIWRGDDNIPATWATYVSLAGSGPGLFAAGELYDPATTIDMTHALQISNYDGTFGGGTGVYSHWTVEATNPGDPDATIATAVGAYPTVYQEDGTDLTGNRADADITTRGRWRSSYCDCWLGGEVLRTWRKWARMTFTIDANEGQIVAVVMPMAPNRGEARIKLDGVTQGRVDTYAPASENRIIMWQTPPLEAGIHTIAVINLATEGSRNRHWEPGGHAGLPHVCRGFRSAEQPSRLRFSA